ncbi:major capsid protein VP54 [Acanthocystis turfacea Chlorella virus GM0701.1]|nr:major capsid protein VP54 [Acanthocystis turfacea Chlorella virus GM0701.1]
MAGGLSQLVAYGAQDVYLTGNPQITFFKTVYRRYTNFAVESIQQTINGSVAFGNKVSTQISRNGDLITDIVVEFVLSSVGPTFYCAEQLLQDVELEIGGQRIDKHYNDWFRTYDSLFRMNDDRVNYRRMTDFVSNESVGSTKRFYVPLIFFFNQTPGLALPLIALQYHEVKLYFTLASQVNGITANAAGATSGFANGATVEQPQMSVYVDYIFLDTQERTRFAQLPHEYLIEQLQFTGSETAVISSTTQASQNIRMNFNHPTKYLAWNFTPGTFNSYGRYTALANLSATANVSVGDTANTATFNEQLAPLDSAKIQLNGQDRFSSRKGSYFNKVQPFQTIGSVVPAGVYLYSFALKPAGRQPSGTCNFSRIDNATLSLTYKTASVNAYDTIANVSNGLGQSETVTANTAVALTNLNIYAKNYNVFRVMSGMGGLAFAN